MHFWYKWSKVFSRLNAQPENQILNSNEGHDYLTAKQLVFMVGVEAMKEFSDENNILPVEVTIHALKEEAKDMDLESGVEDESE